MHPRPGDPGEPGRPLARRALLRPRRRRCRRPGPEARGAQAGAGTSLEVGRGRWLINPGSVGQPRDGDPQGCLAGARHRGLEGRLPPGRLRHRPGRGRDRRRRASRAPRPPPLRRAMSPRTAASGRVKSWDRPSRLARVSVAARISLLACVSTILLTGCGSDPEPTIPAQNAAELLTALDGISASVAAESCDIALSQADDFRSDVDLLPASVDDQVKAGLFEVADRLQELIEEQPGCAPTTAGGGGAPEEPEPTTSTPTTTTPTTTTDTTTDGHDDHRHDDDGHDAAGDRRGGAAPGRAGAGAGGGRRWLAERRGRRREGTAR